MTINLRFAPSPTGDLHLGNLRTALINWLLAKKLNGNFMLRIDDTDTARSEERFVHSIINDLGWLGISLSEDVGGFGGNELETMIIMEEFGKGYGLAPTRVQYKNKDPRGWLEFERPLREHSTLGSANTMRGVQAKRPSLYPLVDELRNLIVPTLILNGDEDEPCLDVGIYLKRTISSSALVTLPKTGHASNLEEPALFNMFCDNFFHQVESNMWSLRDPRSISSNILSTSES